MARGTLEVHVRFPWWARAYIIGCCGFAKIASMTPDTDKIAKTILRHAKMDFGLRTAHPQEGPKT